MSAKLDISIYKDEQGEELLAFYRKELPNWERFESLWHWRHCKANISGGESAAIARYEGCIVGSIGIVPQCLTVGGRTIRAAWQQDSLVSKEMRGKGIGGKLIEAASRGFELVLAKGTSSGMYRLRKALKFNDVPGSDYLVRVFRPRAISETSLKHWTIERVLALWGTALYTLGKRRKSGCNVNEIHRFNPDLDALVHQLAVKKRIRPWKDHQWLNWRYTDVPDRRYAIFNCERKNGKNGALVVTCDKRKEEGWIVDLICAPSNGKTVLSLFRRAMEYFRLLKIKRAYAFATCPMYRRYLVRSGFLPTGRSPGFTFRKTDEANFSDQLLMNVEWDFWHGDGDVELYM